MVEPVRVQPESEPKMRGTMLWFNELKDHGYISTEQGERLYVHGTGFAGGVRPEGPCAGLAVAFRVTDDGGVRQAEESVLVPEVAPRRARRRHGSRGSL
jgi:cold shock CspA family protein